MFWRFHNIEQEYYYLSALYLIILKKGDAHCQQNKAAIIMIEYKR